MIASGSDHWANTNYIFVGSTRFRACICVKLTVKRCVASARHQIFIEKVDSAVKMKAVSMPCRPMLQTNGQWLVQPCPPALDEVCYVPTYIHTYVHT
jgi:hypothetical protein